MSRSAYLFGFIIVFHFLAFHSNFETFAFQNVSFLIRFNIFGIVFCFLEFYIQSIRYNTHSSQLLKLKVPRTRSSYGPMSFRFAAPNAWKFCQNILHLETLIPLSAFKSRVKDIFKESCKCFPNQ